MRRFVTVVQFLVAALSAPASAQLRDCSSIRGGPDYLIVLGDVTAPGQAAAETETARAVLRSKLKNSEDALRLNSEVQRMRIAVCPGRQPGETDFDRNTIEQLSRLNVVLEVWGSLLPSAGGRVAELNAAAIALLQFEPQRSGFFAVTYPRGSATRTQMSVDVLLNDPVELEALATLAVGRRYQQDKRYDAAARSYCQSRAQLARAAAVAPKAEAGNWKELSRFVDDALTRVLADARADDGYRGGLKVLPLGQPVCDEEGS